jgi:hypothetical protein
MAMVPTFLAGYVQLVCFFYSMIDRDFVSTFFGPLSFNADTSIIGNNLFRA